MKAEKKITPETKAETTKAKETTPTKPGVIATIVELIAKSGKKGVTKDQILEVLTKSFPERSPEAMKKTINVQVPSRITKERFPVVRQENGTYIKA